MELAEMKDSVGSKHVLFNDAFWGFIWRDWQKQTSSG